jgi:ABC-type phosphate/phosphonate transport system substrate-binding protein
MYDLPELVPAHDALWSALAERLAARGISAPRRLTRTPNHFEVWRDPHLLLAQACEYPLAKYFQGIVRVVATPCYTATGCSGASYRSAIVIRADDPATSLSDLRGRRCAVNEIDSNSGMNLLRAAVAPLAGGKRFFSAVIRSGAHRHSAALVADGSADVAALDCVSWAHFQRWYPAAMAPLRILAWTPSSPSLPLITAAATSDAVVAAMRASLADVLADEALRSVRADLWLAGFDFSPTDGYERVLELERQAADHGYPVLQ